jgi:outer membrane protein OmpA-like peptidoglycan-associated protein
MNPNRNLYYVYVLNTSDRDQAIAEARRLRDESEFKDTWVYNGFLGKIKAGSDLASYRGVDINPVSEGTHTPATSDIPDPTKEMLMATADSAIPSVPVNNNAKTESVSEKEVEETKGKKFFFKLTRILDEQPVEGDVNLIDHEKLRKIGSYKGNMDVRVVSPPGKSGSVSVVCEVFGYRKMQRDINYNEPVGDGITQSETGATVVPFELVRLQKGDIATMYHVYFFKDAAIMRPESRFEVTSLLEMLLENDKYKIRIHGHANGKNAGKIIYAEANADNFFSLSNTKEGFGSSKKLSFERAEVIRNFLISNGISPDRMQTKAWGGKKPIHDKLSSRAQENVRVEIEILDN